MRFPAFTICLAAMLLCLGCGPVEIAPISAYVAYGDSITYGYRLSDPATENYAYSFAAANKLTLSNRGVTGYQACDVSTREIFSNTPDRPKQSELASLLVGTNDVDNKGTGPYETVFNLCHQAGIAWLAVQASDKTKGDASSVTATGPTHIETSNGWNARVTDGVNATVTFPVQRATQGPIYVWFRISDGNSGAFSYAVDGKVLGSTASATSPAIATQAGVTDSAGLLRIPGIGAGSHRVTFTQTSGGASGAGIIAVAAPSGSAATAPPVAVGTIPHQWMGTGAAICTFSDAPCDQYTADVIANVAIFAADGLNVRIFDTNKYLKADASDMADSVHPNVLGQQEIAHALQDLLKQSEF